MWKSSKMMSHMHGLHMEHTSNLPKDIILLLRIDSNFPTLLIDFSCWFGDGGLDTVPYKRSTASGNGLQQRQTGERSRAWKRRLGIESKCNKLMWESIAHIWLYRCGRGYPRKAEGVLLWYKHHAFSALNIIWPLQMMSSFTPVKLFDFFNSNSTGPLPWQVNPALMPLYFSSSYL